MSKKERGFSLLEVMIAMSILTIGIVAVMGLQYIIAKGVSDGNVVTNQMYVANMILEQQYKLDKKSSDRSLTNVGEDGTGTGPYNIDVKVTDPLNGYSKFVTITVRMNKKAIVGRSIVYRTLTQGGSGS